MKGNTRCRAARLAFLAAALAWAAGPAWGAGGHAGEHGPLGGVKELAKEERQAAKKGADPLEHVMDTPHWHFLEFLGHGLHLPYPLTKYMLLELIAAGIIAAVYIPLAQRLRSGRPPHGAWENTFEVLLVFVRDQIARPALSAPEGHEGHGGHDEHHGQPTGHHADPHAPPGGHRYDFDRYVPFLWTLFLFILVNNLLGLFPFGGSPTASVFATGALALVVFFAIHGSAVARMGLLPYLKTLWPHIDVPFPMGYLITPLVFLIEIIGALVRNAVLAVRLFANMFAGHAVLATILGFIVAAKTVLALWAVITVSSVVGVVALSLLEIFVAFLQAYIFVFLTALFMGMALHPQH